MSTVDGEARGADRMVPGIAITEKDVGTAITVDEIVVGSPETPDDADAGTEGAFIQLLATL